MTGKIRCCRNIQKTNKQTKILKIAGYCFCFIYFVGVTENTRNNTWFRLNCQREPIMSLRNGTRTKRPQVWISGITPIHQAIFAVSPQRNYRVPRSRVHIPSFRKQKIAYKRTITYRLQESNILRWCNCSSIDREPNTVNARRICV